jgi:hypothetical protein
MIRESAAATGLALSLVVLSGCTGPGEQMPDQDTASTPASASSQDTLSDDDRLYDLPNNGCVDLQTSQEAERCAAMMKHGRIALVSAGLDPSVAKRLAKDTEKQISVASFGMIDVDIVPVKATPKALEEFSGSQSVKACVNIEDNSTWLSYESNTSDPKLDDYDIVAGVSTVKACKIGGDFPNTRGVFEPAIGGRFVEVMNAKNELPKDIKPQMISGLPTEIQYDADVLTHEIFHGFGLGHANGLVLPYDQPQLYDVMGRKKPVNLLHMMRDSEFIEYGDSSNIMGTKLVDITKKYERMGDLLNPVQTAWIDTANARVGNDSSNFTTIGEKAKRVKTDQVYTVELEKPLHTSDFAQGESSQSTDYGDQGQYDTVAFYANEGHNSQDYEAPTTLDIALLSDTNDMAEIGTIYQSGSRTEQRYKLGKQTVLVDYDSNGIKISLAK